MFHVEWVDGGLRPLLGVALRSAGVGALYFVGHAATGHLLRFPEPATMPLTWAVVIGGFVILFGVQMVLECRPDGRIARAIQPRLFAGLYLDELFTRMTFRLWPPRTKRPEAIKPTLCGAETLEAR